MERDLEISQAKLAADQVDYERAIKLSLPAAQAGDSETQALVGLSYTLLGEEIDLAVKWLTRAADQGRGDAAHNLGSLYSTLFPAQRDEGKKWFKRALELGFVVSAEPWHQ